jgi:hypothetical protein
VELKEIGKLVVLAIMAIILVPKFGISVISSEFQVRVLS